MKDEIARDVENGWQRGRITEAVNIYRHELGLDDQTILGRLSAKFNITREQARTFAFPEEIREKPSL